MARTTELPLAQDQALHDAAEKERWPVLYTVLFVGVSSAALWALIIGGVRWLLF